MNVLYLCTCRKSHQKIDARRSASGYPCGPETLAGPKLLHMQRQRACNTLSPRRRPQLLTCVDRMCFGHERQTKATPPKLMSVEGISRKL